VLSLWFVFSRRVWSGYGVLGFEEVMKESSRQERYGFGRWVYR
jgi:hypothetical protein